MPKLGGGDASGGSQAITIVDTEDKKNKRSQPLVQPSNDYAPRPTQPTVQQIAAKRGYDVFDPKYHNDATLQKENPKSFETQLSKQMEQWVRFRSIPERIDQIENWSQGRLPTDLSMAVAQSGLPDADLKRLSRLLSRQLSTPLAQLFPSAQRGANNVFINPVTNKPLTLAAARRLYKPYERHFYSDLVKNRGLDPGDVAVWFRALAPIKGEELPWDKAVGMAMNLADQVPVSQAGAFRKNLHFIAADPNLADPKTGKRYSEEEKVGLAYNVAKNGITFQSGSDVVTFLLGSNLGPEPEKGTPDHVAWAARAATWQRWAASTEGAIRAGELAKGTSGDVWQQKYQEKLDFFRQQYEGVWTEEQMAQQAKAEADSYLQSQVDRATEQYGGLPVDAQGNMTEFAANLPEDLQIAVGFKAGKPVDFKNGYNQMVADIQAQYAQEQKDYDNKLVSQALAPIGKVFDKTHDIVNTTLWTVGTGLGVTARIAYMPISHESWDHLTTDAQHYMDIGHRMLWSEEEGGDDYGLAMAMIDESERRGDGVAPWFALTANAMELTAQVVLDPTNYVFGIGKFQKAARMVSKAEEVNDAIKEMRGWEKVMRSVAGGSDTLLAPTYSGRVLEWLGKPIRQLDDMKVADWMIAKARQYKDTPEDLYDAIAYKFRSPMGGEGIPPQITDAIHRWVNLADTRGIRNDAELQDDVHDILATMLGIKPERAQMSNKLADILQGIEEGRRYGLMDNPNWVRDPGMVKANNPHWQPWMTDEKSVKEAEGVARELWNYWDAKPGTVTSMAIPRIGGYTSDARAAIHKALLQSWFGPGIRYRRSIVTSMAANLEEDFPGWVNNYMNRGKGLFTRGEIAQWRRTAASIADPFSPAREAKFIKFIEGLQDEMVVRIARKHGLSDHEVEAFLTETRKRAKDLNRHLYGISDENLQDWQKAIEGDFHSVRDPKFLTQLPNVWMTSDPVRFERMIQEGLGYRKRLTEGIGRVFGKEMSDAARNALTGKETKLSKATVNHLVNSWADWVRSAQGYWKAAVVATPRYLFRVPMGDEQLRFIADAGVMGWQGSRKYVADIGQRLGVSDNFIEFDVRGSEFYMRLDNAAVDAGFVNIDDAVDAELAYRKGVLGDDKVDMLEHLDPDVRDVVKSTVDKAQESGADLSKGIGSWLNAEGLKVRIPLPRPGELLDEAGVNAARATSVFESHEQQAKKMLERMRRWSSENEKFWDEIAPDDPAYAKALSHVLVNQVGRDPVGGRVLRMIVEGKDSATIQKDLISYMAKNEWGRNAAERLGIKSRAALEEHVEQVERMVRDWTMGDEAIASAALKGDAATVSRLADAWAAADPDKLHAVHGFRAAQVLDRSYPGKFLWDTYTKAIFELPTNKLSRQPFFKYHYTQFRGGLLSIAKEQGLDMTPELLRKIEAEARVHAIERTKSIMFDFRRQSRFGEMLWFVAPFYQPWTEAFMVWGKLLRKNPVFANRVRIFHDEMERKGWIRADPVTGEKSVPLSNMWFMAPMLNMAFGGFGGNGFGLSGPLNSFNFVFGSQFDLPTGKLAGNVPLPVPSLNPSLMVLGQQVAKSDMVPDALKVAYTKWAFQYGDQSQNFVGSLLPTYMQHAIRGAKGLPGADLPVVKNVIDVAQSAVGGQDIITSQADDFLRLYEAQGITPIALATDKELAQGIAGRTFKTVDEAQAYLAERAMHQAQQLSEWRSVMSMFMPVAPSVKFPTQELELEYRDYVEKFGYDVGRDKFLEKYPDYSMITIPTTYWNRPDSVVPLPANQLANKIMSGPGAKEFAKENPMWAFALLPNEVWSEQFDRALFFQQMSSGDRATRGPMEMFKAQDEQKGWELYMDAKLDHVAELEDLRQHNVSEDDPAYQALESKWDKYVEAVKTLHPQFAQKLEVFDTSNLDPWVEFGVDKALKSKLFRQTGVGQFLLDYRALREHVMGRMERLGLHTLDTVSAEKYGVKQEYDDGVKELLAQYGPDAERTYNYFFRKDLRSVKTTGDRLLDKLANDDQRYTQFVDWAEKWGKARLTAANASNPAKTTEAYVSMRQMVDGAYDLYGKGNDNPVILWWKTRTQAEKDSYTASVRGRPYVFLSRFDRQVVLGEKTTDTAENAWLQVGRFDAYIAKFKQENPDKSLGGLYDARDALVRKLARGNPVFSRQVDHANQWGYGYFADDTFTGRPGREGEAWSTLKEALANVQAFVVAKDLHGEASFGLEREMYLELRSRMLGLVNYLKDYSPDFRHEWERLETDSPGADLLSDFMPETWFKLGGHS